MASKESKIVRILVALVVAAIGVGVGYLALRSGEEGAGPGFGAWSESPSATADAGIEDVGDPTTQIAEPAPPDPTLAREKLWEKSRDTGPPPDGFSTNLVQHERMMHAVFRRQMGDAVELCLDEMRRRGEELDGRLVFDVAARPQPGLRLRFALNRIQLAANESPDAGFEDLPSDVYQCLWDTIEAVEGRIPVMAAPLFAIENEPELRIEWEVREEGPAGEVDVVDMGGGAAPAGPVDAGSGGVTADASPR